MSECIDDDDDDDEGPGGRRYIEHLNINSDESGVHRSALEDIRNQSINVSDY